MNRRLRAARLHKLDVATMREMKRTTGQQYRAGAYQRPNWDYWGTWCWGFFWGVLIAFVAVQTFLWIY